MDLSEESEGETDEEEHMRLLQAKEVARRQSESAFLSKGNKRRVRSPPPPKLVEKASVNQGEEDDLTFDLSSKVNFK